MTDFTAKCWTTPQILFAIGDAVRSMSASRYFGIQQYFTPSFLVPRIAGLLPTAAQSITLPSGIWKQHTMSGEQGGRHTQHYQSSTGESKQRPCTQWMFCSYPGNKFQPLLMKAIIPINEALQNLWCWFSRATQCPHNCNYHRFHNEVHHKHPGCPRTKHLTTCRYMITGLCKQVQLSAGILDLEGIFS